MCYIGVAEIRKIHEEIQKKIFFMLPEKWDRLYLYASVIEKDGQFQTGEMFFYYFPKGILKKKPVNVYEIPGKFNIDEAEYSKHTDELYTTIKKLKDTCVKNNERPWTNVTIAIEGLKYRAIYGYEDLVSSELDSTERRAIWRYRYLKIPYESLNRKEKQAVERYEKGTKERETIYELPLYTKPQNKNLETITDMERKFEFVTEEKIEEMEEKEFTITHVPKSQILK